MKILLQIHPTNDEMQPLGDSLQTGISLPRGCGIDEASKAIKMMAEAFESTALELFKADTEGREPVFE